MFHLRSLLPFLLLLLCVPRTWAQDAPSLAHAVEVDPNFESKTVLMGKDFRVPIRITRTGTEQVRSVGIVYQYQDKVSSEYVYTLSQPIDYIGSSTTIDVGISAPKSSSYGPLRIYVNSVNNQPNETDRSKRRATGELIVLRKASPQKVVVEDYTGTWCQYCPQGISALKILASDFADRVIPIAVHTSNDVMYSPDYVPVIDRYVTGFPRILVNRKVSYTRLGKDYKTGEPYALLNDIYAAEAQLSPAAINITQATLNEKETQVNIRTSTTFQMNAQDAPYRLAYVLLADGLTGTSKAWLQVNGYAGNTAMEQLLPDFVHASGRVRIPFDHTVVRAAHVLEGEPASLPSTLQEGKAYAHQHSFDISDTHSNQYPYYKEHIIQDKRKLTAVVLLIHAQTGAIINAASAPVLPHGNPQPIAVHLNAKGIATLATPQALTLPQGLKALAVLPHKSGQLRLQVVATAGQHLPAGVGVLLQSEDNATSTDFLLQPAPQGASTVQLPTGHLLRPATNNGTIQLPNHKLYILADDPAMGLGFYWQQNSEGRSLHGIEGRAYLALPEGQAQTSAYTLHAGALTGLNALSQPTNNTDPLYDLSGRRVPQATRGAIYIQQGQKWVK